MKLLPRWIGLLLAMTLIPSIGGSGWADTTISGTFNQVARLFSPEFRHLDDRRSELQQSALPNYPLPSWSLSAGYHSWAADQPNRLCWVQVDLGEAQPLDAVVLVPAANPSGEGGAGYYFPARFRVELSDQSDFADSALIFDQTAEDLPSPGEQPVIMPAAPCRSFHPRHRNANDAAQGALRFRSR